MIAIQRELTATSSPRSDCWLSLAFSGRSVRKVKPWRSETPRPPKVAADWAYEGKPTARVMSGNAGLRRWAAGDHTPRLASGDLFFPDAWGVIHVSVFSPPFQPPPADEDAVLRVLGRVHQEVMCERSGLFLPSGAEHLLLRRRAAGVNQMCFRHSRGSCPHLAPCPSGVGCRSCPGWRSDCEQLQIDATYFSVVGFLCFKCHVDL